MPISYLPITQIAKHISLFPSLVSCCCFAHPSSVQSYHGACLVAETLIWNIDLSIYSRLRPSQLCCGHAHFVSRGLYEGLTPEIWLASICIAQYIEDIPPYPQHKCLHYLLPPTAGALPVQCSYTTLVKSWKSHSVPVAQLIGASANTISQPSLSFCFAVKLRLLSFLSLNQAEPHFTF
jgi:hypothetical protein